MLRTLQRLCRTSSTKPLLSHKPRQGMEGKNKVWKILLIPGWDCKHRCHILADVNMVRESGIHSLLVPRCRAERQSSAVSPSGAFGLDASGRRSFPLLRPHAPLEGVGLEHAGVHLPNDGAQPHNLSLVLHCCLSRGDCRARAGHRQGNRVFTDGMQRC